MKNIIISGASKGIGKAIALRFAAAGFNVAICARNKKLLDAVLKEMKMLHPAGKFMAEVCDLTDKLQIKNFAANVLKQWKHIDILVNNAGTFSPGLVHQEKEGSLELMMQTNLFSAYYLSRAIVPAMKKKKSGHIFNMSSVAGIKAYPNGGSYSISKFALQGFSKSLREELKESGIRVTAILPGATLTDSWAAAKLPASRFMPAEDIAETIFQIYSLSDRTVVEEIILRPQLGDI